MISSVVRNHIEHTLEDGEARSLFRRRLRALSKAQGATLNDEDIEALAELAERYVQETLHLIETCDVAAQQARAEQLVTPLCETSLKVLAAQIDSAGPATGLFGLMCDAYIARCLVSRLSDSLRSSRGVPLLATDSHPEAPIIRRLLGMRLAAELDTATDDLLSTPRLKTALNNAYNLQNPLNASVQGSEWGGTCAEGMANIFSASGIRIS